MIKTNDYCSENERLNNREFLDLIPHLPLQDLLQTEYRVDIKWNRLIELRDPSKKLYQCSVCSVVQSGAKNLFAHVDGKKHKLKMNSVKQLYQPKYTYKKMNIGSLIQSKPNCPSAKTSIKYPSLERPRNTSDNENKSTSLAVYDNEKSTSPKINKYLIDEAVKSSVVNINIDASTNETERTIPKKKCGIINQEIIIDSMETEDSPDKADNNDIVSTVIVIDNNKDQDYKAELDKANCKSEDLDIKNANGPPPKKTKMVPNPVAVNTNQMDKHIKEFYPDDGKPEYQSNITIIPTKIKRKESNCVGYRHCDKELFTTKRFSCNPLDDDVHGLVGVEYVVKILKSPNDSLPKYECGLCEVLNDGLGMQNHLIGYNHRLKFCEKHFPTALRQYRQYIRNISPSEVYKVMTPILNRLAIAIEQHHGRDLPYECSENEFNVNRHEVLSKVFSCRHASEQYGPTFTHIIDSKEVDKLIAEVDKYTPPLKFSQSIVFDLHANVTPFQTKSVNRKRQRNANIFSGYNAQSFDSSLHRHSDEVVSRTQTLDNETHKLMVDDFLKNTCKQANRSSRPGNNKLRSDSISSIIRSSSQRKSLSPLRENDVWQAYRHLVDQKVRDLNEVFQIYRSDPEIHPAYDQEWQMFWKRRKNELIEAGLDHRTYNYQPEWVRFFNIRIEELYNQAVENIKIDARERLYLPMTNDNSLFEKYHVHAKIIDEVKTDDNSAVEKFSKKELKCDIDEYTEKHHVVSVLRLLTALENYLGSLGPKIVKLLSKALQAQKNNLGELDAIILTTENCSILETAMEKLKGLIIAGIFDNTKQNVLKKAIAEVEFLLSQTAKKMSKSHYTSNFDEIPEQKSNITKEKQLFANILAQVDKKELALKLASLLAAQGKTDIDPIQLQKIISVYMLIEKKKQETLSSSRSGCNDLLSQNSMYNPPSENNSKFLEPSFSQRQLDSRLSMYDNTCIDKFQENFVNMLSRNSNENFSNATFGGRNSSNGIQNMFSSNYQQHMNSGKIIGSQQSLPRQYDEQVQNFFDYKTRNLNYSQGQNNGNINWSGTNGNWRKY